MRDREIFKPGRTLGNHSNRGVSLADALVRQPSAAAICSMGAAVGSADADFGTALVSTRRMSSAWAFVPVFLSTDFSCERTVFRFKAVLRKIDFADPYRTNACTIRV